MQSGKPVGVFQTHPDAPRVLIANSNLVPRWATWEHFHELDRKGLMMYGQMTAGSWIYIGSQGIVQGTYETFAAVAKKHFGGNAAGQVDSHRRARRHGRGAAAGRDDGRVLAARRGVRRSRIDFRLRTRYLDRKAASLDEALAIVRERKPVFGRACSATRRMCARSWCSAGITPDVVTDQTSAHDPLNGYLPQGWTLAEWREQAKTDPATVIKAAKASMAVHVRAMLELQKRGAVALDYGNNIRQMAKDEGVANAFDIPGFRAGVHPPAVLRGDRPVPLGGALRRSRPTSTAPTRR